MSIWPASRSKKTIHMTKGRKFFVMQCGFHAYMESWGLAVDNPYYHLTDSGGAFLADGCATGRLYADGLASGRRERSWRRK